MKSNLLPIFLDTAELNDSETLPPMKIFVNDIPMTRKNSFRWTLCPCSDAAEPNDLENVLPHEDFCPKSLLAVEHSETFVAKFRNRKSHPMLGGVVH